MSLPEGEPTVKVRDLVELFSPDGSLGYFRVSAVSQRIGHTQEVDLEHSIATLDDDLTGKEQTLTGTMTEILRKILGWQSTKRWVLGDVECKEAGLTLAVDRDTLRDAVVACVKLVDNYGMFFEQSGTRWRLHVRKLPTTPNCEARLSRNAAGVEIKIDDQELCTRVVDDALPNGEMSVDSPEWGVVTRTVNIPPGATKEEAEKYVKAYLKQHKVPTVSIEIEGVALAEYTGEALDVFDTGAMCRAVLPDYGIVQSQRIILMDWPNMLTAPNKVYLTMSKPERRIEEVVARNRSGSGGASRKANEAQKRVAIVADDIALHAHDLDGALLRLDKAEAAIVLRVKKGETINEINLDSTGLTINTNKVNLNGFVTVSALSAYNGTISATTLQGTTTYAGALFVNGYKYTPQAFTGQNGKTYMCLAREA